MSATFFVTSVPVMPMPIPISALFIDGASLTPSPVMAVILPFERQALTILVLCSGCTRAYTYIFSTLSANSSSLIAESSAPVIACDGSVSMPSSEAIATAVSLWSPVIMTGVMPAPRHSSIAALTSGRTGSIMPVSPIKTRSCSSASGEKSSGAASYFLIAAASTRSALSAIRLFSAAIFALISSVMGTVFPSIKAWVHRSTTTSGAPFVY